jgi:hypothetical protein
VLLKHDPKTKTQNSATSHFHLISFLFSGAPQASRPKRPVGRGTRCRLPSTVKGPRGKKNTVSK